ncbi:OmpP1/FadL family transporter [Undibacterium sp.]|uniref:OmpP1/FadL family transporter n=1 Tax=Undibacterium sp. TaxID=1914977 RepID=UPI00375049F7
MQQRKKDFKFTTIATAIGVALLAQNPASATDGYFSHGYGIKAKGMGGAATAMNKDAFGGANNPASMVFVGNRMDVGVDWFKPSRDATRSGAAIPTLNGKSTSGENNFLIPEFGYNRMLSNDMSLGISVYGNGGLNTTYDQGSFNCGNPSGNNMLCGGGKLGVDMIQLILAPTFAMKLNNDHAIGVSMLLGYQRFKADGLQAFNNSPGFPPFTGAPGFVTNNGYDSSTGVGLRVGYQGKLTDNLTLGIAYANKMDMKAFDKYKGLFAQQGDFDIPENYSVGFAYAPDKLWTIAVDYQRINYSGVSSIGNSSMPKAPLGAMNGPGFGWKDIDVFKLGVEYKFSEQLELRAGYNQGKNPIGNSDVTFNILAPGVVQTHLTLGMSYVLNKESEISASFMHAPRQTVSGPSLFNGLFPAPPNAGGTETIGMSQNALGVAWSMKF